MESASIYRILGLSIFVLFVFGVRAMRGQIAKGQHAANPQLGLANMAAALGMRIVTGDPGFHFAVGPTAVPWALLLGLHILKYDVRLEGLFGNRSMALTVHSYRASLRVRRVTLWEKEEYDARLTLSGVALPCDFEAVLVPSASTLLAANPSGHLPPVHRGPTPMGEMEVRGADAAALAPLLPTIGQFGQFPYVHLVGAGTELHFVFTEIAFASVAGQLPTIRDGMLALADLASASRRGA